MGAFPYPIVGPVATYTNFPINANYYKPSVFFISNITFGSETNITTTVNHNYVIGQQIRLTIPPTYGAQQLNEQTGFVNSIPSANQVVVSINSQVVDPFNASPSYGPTLPQIVAIGDINTGSINSNGTNNTSTYIPGSFINISPN